jgi:multidrug efflux pump subunit AcrA (membrane-fusion protein)
MKYSFLRPLISLRRPAAFGLLCWTAALADCHPLAAQTSISPNETPAVQPPALPGSPTLPGTGSGPNEPARVPPAALQANRPATRNELVDSKAILTYVNDTDITATADGILMRIGADEGATIAKESILLDVDSRMVQAQLKVAQKKMEAASEKARDRSNIEFSEKSYEVAKLQLEMFQKLADRDATSLMELESKRLEAEKARLAGVVAEVQNRQDVAAEQVAEAEAEAASVELQLRQIRAPFDGVVVDRKKQLFDWVRAGEPVLRLVGMERVRVNGRISAQDLQGPPHLLENAPATAIITLFSNGTPQGTQEVSINGNLGFVSPVLDPSGMYEVWMEIGNQQVQGRWLLREGMRARLVIPTPSG